MINEYRRLLVRLLRSGHHRRVPPQHLRQVERRARPLRRHPDRPDRDALRRARTPTSCRIAEDGAFVRDTLRFFEVDAPDLPLHAAGGHRRRATWSPTGSTRRRPSRPRPRAASRSAATSSTGPRWTTRRGPSSRSCSARRRHDHGRPDGPGAPVHDPRAQPRDGARVPRGAREGLHRAGMACAGRRSGARPSSSPSPSATPRRSPGCSMRSSPTRSPPPDDALCRLRGLRPGAGGHGRRARP